MNKLKESSSVPTVVKYITALEVYNYLSDDYTGSLEKLIIIEELTKLHKKRLSLKAEEMLDVRVRRIQEIRDKKSKLLSWKIISITSDFYLSCPPRFFGAFLFLKKFSKFSWQNFSFA